MLGGRGMMIAYDAEHLRDYMAEAARISPDYPVYLDRFLRVRSSPMSTPCAMAKRSTSAAFWSISRRPVFTPATLRPAFRRSAFSESLQAKLRETTRRIAMALGVRGLVNVQYAIKGETVYVIEANPRASRTVPFISKATGVPLAKCAAYHGGAIPSRAWGLPSHERQLDWFCMKGSRYALGPFPRAPTLSWGPR